MKLGKLFLWIFIFLRVSILASEIESQDERFKELLNSLHERTYDGDSSLIVITEELTLYFESINDTSALIRALVLKSTGDRKTAKYDIELADLVKAQRLYKSADCHPQIGAYIKYGYGLLYKSINEIHKADSITREAIISFQDTWPDKTLLIRLYISASNNQSNHELSLAYLDTALVMSQKFAKPVFSQTILINIGSSYAEQGDFKTAKKYFAQAIPLARQKPEKRELAILFNNLAGLSENQDDILLNIDSAIYYAKLEGDIFHEQMFTENKAYFLSEAGNYKKGYEHLFDAMELKDSVLNEKKIDAVTEIQEKYEAEKRNNEIQQLKVEKLNTEVEKLRYRRNQNILIFGSSSLLVLFIILYVYFISVRKNRNRLAERNVIIQRERKRSDDLLLNILPSEVAEELKETGKAEAREFETATVLFTDFKGFTAMSAKLSASELVEEINVCFKAFDNIMGTYELEKIKTIGDAYMAAGGLQHAKDSKPANVIKAGLDMQAFIQNRKVEREAQGLMAFEMRAGIHTGPVVAGIVGVKKFQYDIWGDTVNTASRMESSGEAGMVNISESTYQLVKHNQEFNFNFRGEIAAKGKGALPMWFVTSESSTS